MWWDKIRRLWVAIVVLLLGVSGLVYWSLAFDKSQVTNLQYLLVEFGLLAVNGLGVFIGGELRRGMELSGKIEELNERERKVSRRENDISRTVDRMKDNVRERYLHLLRLEQSFIFCLRHLRDADNFPESGIPNAPSPKLDVYRVASGYVRGRIESDVASVGDCLRFWENLAPEETEHVKVERQRTEL